MQLLDRYLTAIKFWLPKAQRQDIVSELGANLQAEIDDRAAELGHPLTDAEIANLLKQHGSPIVAASRYRQENRTVTFGRQLIGSFLFPFYWVTLQVMLVLLLIQALVPVVLFHPDVPLVTGLVYSIFRLIRFSLPVLLVVTAAFALLDYCLRKFGLIEKWSSDWDPGRLPSADRQEKQVRRSGSIAGIIVQSLILTWWWNHGRIPSVVITNAGAGIHFAPVFVTLYLPILILLAINLAQHGVNLFQPNWRWLPPITGLITGIGALVVLFPLLWISPLISIVNINGTLMDPNEAAGIQQVLWVAIMSLWISIVIACAIFGWQLLRILWNKDSGPLPEPRSHSAACF